MKKRWARWGNTVWYRPDQRFGDWSCARRDARAGVPAVPAHDTAQVPPHVRISVADAEPAQVWATPRTLRLEQTGRVRAEREWIRYDADTADDLVARAAAAGRLAVAQRRLREIQDELVALGDVPTAQQLDLVAAGEEDSDMSVRHGRRHRDHARRRATLAATVHDERETATEAELEIAWLDERIRIRREVAESRVAMIQAHVRLRCSAYLTHLVRRHPQGEVIGSILRSAWSVRPARDSSRPVPQRADIRAVSTVKEGA